MDTAAPSDEPLAPFKRIIELYNRNTTVERALFHRLDDKMERYEKEIRKLRQKMYGQQIELRAKEFQLTELAAKEAEAQAIIKNLRRQLSESNEKIDELVTHEQIYVKRIMDGEEKLHELKGICELTAGTLRRSAGSNSNADTVTAVHTDGDDSGAEK